MRLILWLPVLAGIAAGAAWLTRPGSDAFDAHLRAAIERRIATTDVGTGDDPVATIALVGCKLRPSDCFTLLRQSLDVTIEDRVLYTRFHVKGLNHAATCTGAFTRIWCREDPLGS
ncbi:hypothetical protein [Defluviimonas salinarum]|uniref:Uncharacterized protein n=1 Tax=Defluviimonas salinarum TaxID=2992147 RepID=A0ABT3J6R0_9RHOB|nr:hypothetical protein [Defluviimonas salinarum]MCW3783357.1 hypothetical protein [Defluviimonas salinarum]